jgi:hypothetical protein
MLAAQRNPRRRRFAVKLARIANGTNAGTIRFFVNVPLAQIRVGVSVAAYAGANLRTSTWTITPQAYDPDISDWADLQVPAGRLAAVLPDGYSVADSPEADRVKVDVTFSTGSDFGAVGGRFVAVVTFEAYADMSLGEFKEFWWEHCSVSDPVELVL